MHAEPQPSPEEDTVPPGDDSNTDPTPPLPADPGRGGGERNPSASAGHQHPPMDEEPELNNSERDIPSDGRDREGEGMIRDLDKPTEHPGDKPKGHDHGH
ncbi:MAG: hypothetical protein EOO54_05660 [Haliea sp.]|nr:MAG: hypothetical protein EOO54_05660 [Haliea sp.]